MYAAAKANWCPVLLVICICLVCLSLCMHVVRSLCIYHSYLTPFLDRRLVSPSFFPVPDSPAQSIAYPEIPGVLTWVLQAQAGADNEWFGELLFGDVVQPAIRRQLRQLLSAHRLPSSTPSHCRRGENPKWEKVCRSALSTNF